MSLFSVSLIALELFLHSITKFGPVELVLPNSLSQHKIYCRRGPKYFSYRYLPLSLSLSILVCRANIISRHKGKLMNPLLAPPIGSASRPWKRYLAYVWHSFISFNRGSLIKPTFSLFWPLKLFIHSLIFYLPILLSWSSSPKQPIPYMLP